MKANCFKWEEIILESDLPAYAKYLGLYLRTFMNNKQDVAWPSLSRISQDTGLSKPTVIKYLDVLEDGQFLIKTQSVSSSMGGDQLHNNYIAHLPEKVVKEIYYPTQKGSKADEQRGLISEAKVVNELYPNNNRITINNNTRFNPPNIEEIKQYCEERKNHIDAIQFFNFYESKNWMIGKNKMKNWKAAIRTWERNDFHAKPKDLLPKAI